MLTQHYHGEHSHRSDRLNDKGVLHLQRFPNRFEEFRTTDQERSHQELQGKIRCIKT